MARAIWKGSINFGLVNIPVALYSAESHNCDVKLHWLDKRDLSPVGYTKTNKNTGEKVPAEQLVEAYEHKDGEYIILSKEELKNIRPIADESVEILEFVDGADIQPEYFDKPYYLEPIKKGKRGYVLLREVLRDSGKVGIAKVVIHTRQYLAALLVEDKALLLELLRFPCELKSANELDLPSESLSALGIQKKEKHIAEELVNSMTTKWDPAKYVNDYQGSLLDFIMEKIKLKGRSVLKKIKSADTGKEKGEVVSLMALLQKSVEKSKSRDKKQAKTYAKKSPKRQIKPKLRK